MWWIALSVPLMLLGVAIAVVSVSWGSAIHERLEKEDAADRAAYAARSTVVGRALLPHEASARVDCARCGVELYARSQDDLAGRVGRHLWTIHGVRFPEPERVLEPALVH
jgi:uncharacterized paraquat-inducible protein A